MILSGEQIKHFGLLQNADEKNMQAQGWDVRLEKVYHIIYKPYGEKIKEEDYKEFSLPYGAVPANTSVLFKLMETVDLSAKFDRTEGELDSRKLRLFNALVLPKSSLTRRGVSVHSAWWDAGYVGSGMVLVRTSDTPLKIKPGDSFGQMIFFEGTRTSSLYAGQYQNEGITSEEMYEKENEVFEIYTHNEYGEETEFEIRDMDGFLANNSKYLDKLVKELESKVAFQRDLKYAVDHDMVQCFDSATGENITTMDTDYLQSAITANLRTITRIRTHLGWDPEPVIANDTVMRIEYYKSKRGMN